MSDEIFISYANEDEARVEPLARLLEAEGWSVWWDRDIPVGRTFDEVIEEALDAARCVIVVWTEESVASRWVKTEAGEGTTRNILVPVLLDDVRIPLAFRRIQAADLVGWEGEQQHPGVEQLVEAVSRVAGSPKREAPEREEEDETPRTVAIEPEPEGQAEAIPDEIVSEEEASVAEPEDISRPEDVEPEVEPVGAKQAGAASIDDEQGGAEESEAEAVFEGEDPVAVEVEGPEAGDAEEAVVEAVEEAVREQQEEQTVAPPPGDHVAPPEASPEEEPAPPEEPVPARFARWIKEPKRLALVAGVVGLVVIALVVVSVIQNGNSSDDRPPPGVASIEINRSEARIAVDSTMQLTAILRDSLKTLLTGRLVVWESSDSTIASVDSAGVVTGLKADSTQIIARSEGVEESIKITVFAREITPVPVAAIEIAPFQVSLQVGQREQLRATLKDEGGNTLSGRTVSWTSSNTSVASVSETGVVTGRGEGSATLTANGEGVRETVTVSVTPVPVAAVEVTPSPFSLEVGGARKRLTATVKDASENTLSGRAVTWTSSDSSIASVTQAGVVTGLKEGSATITAKSEAAQGTARVSVTPGIPNIDFVQISAGSFRMGSTNGGSNEQPVHPVRISSFSMSATEVTQGQWKAVMSDNPSRFTGDDELPVESVSWNDVQTFISQLNTLQDCHGCYRLPTEAEWEYAARAGTTGDYAGDLEAMGWYVENSDGKTHPVRQKRRNAWGLYDMHGNVWEWVSDWHGRYPSGTVTNPTGPETGSSRVFRGGGWNRAAGGARSAFRYIVPPDYRGSYLGFRLVRTGL